MIIQIVVTIDKYAKFYPTLSAKIKSIYISNYLGLAFVEFDVTDQRLAIHSTSFKYLSII